MKIATGAYAAVYAGILVGPSIASGAARAGGYACGHLGAKAAVGLGSAGVVARATASGYSALNAPGWIYDGLEAAGEWRTFNQAYLEGAIARGSEIVPLTEVHSAQAGAYLVMEHYYLVGKGIW